MTLVPWVNRMRIAGSAVASIVAALVFMFPAAHYPDGGRDDVYLMRPTSSYSVPHSGDLESDVKVASWLLPMSSALLIASSMCTALNGGLVHIAATAFYGYTMIIYGMTVANHIDVSDPIAKVKAHPHALMVTSVLVSNASLIYSSVAAPSIMSISPTTQETQ